ncbi:DUF6792 domain-containing protein [Campylobacter taeniopygiae]|uniref:DUF6792 domain-containing protein n=1 Tax=Campylobacter taeniopygiae TaxID=2510188 RepID=UPI003D6C68BF
MDKNGKSQVVRDKGDLTAYATAIEARFSADLVFKKPKKDNEKEDEEITKQRYLLALNFKEQKEYPDGFRYHLSPRTKKFVSRYEVIDHVKNTSINGYSHTIFKDTTKNNNTYILAFRGTETSEDQVLKDLVFTDGFIALGNGIPQIISLINYSDDILNAIRKKHKSDDFKIDIVGHSLGGHLAQCFCIFGQKIHSKTLYL